MDIKRELFMRSTNAVEIMCTYKSNTKFGKKWRRRKVKTEKCKNVKSPSKY